MYFLCYLVNNAISMTAAPGLQSTLDEEYKDVTPKVARTTLPAPLSTATDSTIQPTEPAMSPLADEKHKTSMLTPTPSRPIPVPPKKPPQCPTSVVHDPRESGARVYTGYFPVQGQQGATQARGLGATPADFQRRMQTLKQQGCPPLNPVLTSHRLQQIGPWDLSWQQVAATVLGSCLGVYVAKRYS